VPARFAAALLCLAVPAAHAAEPLRVLAFSRTTGFRHDSIPVAHAVLQALAPRHRMSVVASEDAGRFAAVPLADFDVVLFLNTTGDVLDATQQAALQAFVENGGGWVGVHAAADTEYGWPFYGTLLGNGAWFASHPAIQPAGVVRESADHPAVSHWPAGFVFTDEWYNFGANPRAAVQVLLRLDESSYAPGTGAMGADHPIAWARPVGDGRAFYTGLGHRAETFRDAGFQRHLVAALHWSAGRAYDTLFVDGFDPVP
jgi:type 1 glutamine amidotransferase